MHRDSVTAGDRCSLAEAQAPCGTATLAFDLCGIAFLIETAPSLQESRALWILPLRVLSNLASAIFLLWSEDLFGGIDDARQFRRWIPLGVMLVLAICAVLFDTAWHWHLVHAAALVLITYSMVRVLHGRAPIGSFSLWALGLPSPAVPCWVPLAFLCCRRSRSSSASLSPRRSHGSTGRLPFLQERSRPQGLS